MDTIAKALKTEIVLRAFSFFSEMDILKAEHFATPAVGDSVQPSLVWSSQKDSEDNRQSPAVNSSDQEKTKDVHLEIPDAADSFIPKENSSGSFPRKEREELPPSSVSNKTTLHFDQPNRLVCALCFDLCLFLLCIGRLEELQLILEHLLQSYKVLCFICLAYRIYIYLKTGQIIIKLYQRKEKHKLTSSVFVKCISP